MAFGKQLDLFVVRMARDRTWIANPSGHSASQAEVDGLPDVTKVVSALGERMRERKGGFADELVLRG